MRIFGKIMLIIGMVIGSGFASGKEIAVFFSRFGCFSYIFIPFAFLLFFGVFFWILSHGKSGTEKLNSSKILLSLYTSISLVFTSSMFAGTKTTMSFGNKVVDIVLIIILLLTCVYVSKTGIKALEKFNSYLIPITIVILIVCLIKNVGHEIIYLKGSFPLGFMFSILYVVMNVSTSSFVMGQMGKTMTKKEIFWVSFFASLILSVLLLFINFVILTNFESLNYSMPLLQISNGVVYVLMRIVIFVGCLTTLLSLVYTTSKSLSKLGIGGVFNFFISVFFPFVLSFLGFGKIVSFVYPVASVVGICLLFPFVKTK